MKMDRYSAEEVHTLARRLRIGFVVPKKPVTRRTKGVALPEPEPTRKS